MEKLVEIMSSNKSQVKTLLTTKAQLVKNRSEKDATITRLTKEMSNLVNIITNIASKNNSTNNINNKAEKLSFDRSRAKNQMITHSIKMDTAGRTVIVSISITVVQTVNPTPQVPRNPS